MRKPLALIGALALAVLLAACHPPYQGNPSGPKVAILSDSILSGNAGSHLQYFISDTHQSSRSALPGATSIERVTAAQAWNGTADIAVISLGANDAHQIAAGTLTANETYDYGFTPIRDAFSTADCIVYVVLDEHGPNATSNANTGTAKLMNDWWRLHALYWPGRYKLADWNGVINANGGAAAYTWDGLHPNPAGDQLLAEIIEDAVESCP